MTRIKPTAQRVLVEPMQGVTETVGSIVIPEAHRDKAPAEGVVVNVAAGVTRVQIGDRVVIPRYDGTDVRVGRTMFKLYKESEILAVIEN